VCAQPPNKQLERTVIRRRMRAGSAPLHYALAARRTERRAAAQLRRYASSQRAVIRLIELGFFLFSSSVCTAQQTQLPDPCDFQPELILDVTRTLHPYDATITVCSHWDLATKFLRIRVLPKRAGAEVVERVMELDHPTYLQVAELHAQALRYNVMDDSLGPDGSRWCLETNRGATYLKACFWTPSADPAKRGLEGLYRLGEFLWGVATLEQQIGRLY
jgi:hypothetical protein